MRTRGSLSGAGIPPSTAGGPSSVAASAATESRRELRPRRRTVQATEIRGAPPGATKPHAAVPRTGGRVTRRLAATLAANSDDSSSDESFTLSTRTDVPLRPRNKANRPRRIPSASQFSSGPPAPTFRSRNSRLGKRTRPQSGFYDEDSDEVEEAEESDLDEDEDLARISPNPDRSRQHPPVSRTQRTRPRTPKFKKAKVDRSPKHGKIKASSVQASFEVKSTESEFVPDWLSLDYFIWVQIFEVAAASLDDRDGVSWLLSTSRICKTFAEPAMTALYRCPALLTRPMAHQLLSLLAEDPSTTLFNYRAKVEKLRIDVGNIARKSHRGRHLDFGALVSYLPRLKVIDFHHTADNPPYRRFKESLKWHYPDGLFEALNNTQDAGVEPVVTRKPTRLIGWRWNSRMMGTASDQETLDKIRTLHLTPCFANLKRLSFVNFQVPSLDVRHGADDPEVIAKDQAFVQGITNAVSALPDLEHLSMESSTVVNEYFLPLLPKTLKTLELVNCWDINGEDFASYLLTHGHNLEHLFLHHNQSLSLAFLTVLGSACPSLKTLRMDLKTFNHHEFYNDSDPSYDQLLAVDQVPHWPVSLETLELRNMRKWEAAGAELLFQSLVDSAPTLPNLRCLDLKAMLDIPFRQRSELRDKWEARIKRVFLRKLEDPLPFRSLRQAPGGPDEQLSPNNQKSRKCKKVESPSRRSGRIATQISRPSSRDSSMGHGLRQNAQGRPSYVEPDTDGDELASADDGDNSDAESSATRATPGRISEPSMPGSLFEEFFHHGLCEKVEIQLDNQKPTERTLTMEDFLDDTVSDDPSDEDWDGDQDVDTGYAW
ncbi:F-box protein At-B [Rhypophila sp. PSN 637]